jgi:hypothetical protein
MAKSISKASKKKTVRATPNIKRGAKMLDYNWSGWETWSGAKYHDQRRRAVAYYYDNNKPADMLKFLHQWMKEQKYSKPDIDAIKTLSTTHVNINTCIIAKCLLTGMPAENPRWTDYWTSLPGTMGEPRNAVDLIKEKIERVIEIGRVNLKKKKKTDKAAASAYVPTIQERITEQSQEAAADIDEWLDGFVTDRKTFDPNGFDFKGHFAKMNVSQAHARKIRAFFAGELEEMQEVAQIPSPAKIRAIKDDYARDQIEQLKEGYAYLKKADIAKMIKAIENLIGALDMIIEESKAKRKSPVRKPKSADKIVAKVKYKVKDEKYQLVSVNPIDIVGANELWVFNTKTRKLGKYVAINQDPKGMQREGTGLSVKGTTIIGFNEDESIQRTLRKPEEQLKEFKACGKVKLRKFMDTVKTIETKMNGRINADTILLKVS